MGSGYADSSVNGSARAIKTLVRFWHEEKYLPEPIIFAMPKIAKKHLLVLTAEQLNTVLKACRTPRDKDVVLFMADSGLRRAEVIGLHCGDIDMTSGLVTVRRGKGGKARSAVIGARMMS